MNHQPFETWLLSDEELTPENERALDEHLETCDHCQEINNAWLGVVDLFAEMPDMAPAPGFVDRFQIRLTTERQVDLAMRHRWQSVIMLILIGNVIAALVFLLGSQFLTTFETPTQLVLSWVYRLASTLTFVKGFQNLFLTLFRTITSIVPAGFWAILGIGLAGSGAIWAITMKSLSVLPRRT